MTNKLPPLPEPMGYVPFAGEFYQAAELDQEVKDDAETVWCFSMQQMRAYAEEAVRLEREAIFEEVCKVSDGVFMMLHANGITGAEHQSVQSAISVIRNTIRARSAAIRARSEVAPDPTER